LRKAGPAFFPFPETKSQATSRVAFSEMLARRGMQQKKTPVGGPKVPEGGWGNIPQERLFSIFEVLEDGMSLCVCSMVNSHWYYTSQCPSLWFRFSMLLQEQDQRLPSLPNKPPTWPRWRGFHMTLLRQYEKRKFNVCDEDLVIALRLLKEIC